MLEHKDIQPRVEKQKGGQWNQDGMVMSRKASRGSFSFKGISILFSSVLLTIPKPLTVCITTNRENFLKRWEYQTTWPPSWEICMQVKKQQLEPDMKQQTGSKLGKEYIKAVYCHPAYLTSMQSTSCEMPGWIKHSGIKIQEKYQ